MQCFILLGLKVLTNSLLASLPALGNVAILLAFSYLVFAILGMELYRGHMHYRCRLTPYPVKLDFDPLNAPVDWQFPPNQSYIDNIVTSPESYRCTSWNISDAWLSPTSCFWPTDPSEDSNPLLCSNSISAGRQCPDNTYCGSNYDSIGHPRFNDIMVNGTSVFSITRQPVFNSNLNYGFTNFDNVYSSFVVIIQTVTASGWMVLTQTVLFSSLCNTMLMLITFKPRRKMLEDLLSLAFTLMLCYLLGCAFYFN